MKLLEAVWPSGFVTTTLTAPAVCGGVVAKINVWLETLPFVAGNPPNVTVAPGVNPSPEMDTDVPPTVDPVFGLTDVIVGGRYENPFARVAVCPSAFVTTTSTTPGRCDVVLTIMLAAVIETKLARAPPNVTVVPEAKPVP